MIAITFVLFIGIVGCNIKPIELESDSSGGGAVPAATGRFKTPKECNDAIATAMENEDWAAVFSCYTNAAQSEALGTRVFAVAKRAHNSPSDKWATDLLKKYKLDELQVYEKTSEAIKNPETFGNALNSMYGSFENKVEFMVETQKEFDADMKQRGEKRRNESFKVIQKRGNGLVIVERNSSALLPGMELYKLEGDTWLQGSASDLP